MVYNYNYRPERIISLEMKILLCQKGEKTFSKSGIGRAMKHQMAALKMNNVEITTDEKDDDYDILHINTVGLNSYTFAVNAKRKGKKIVYHAHSTEEDFRDSFIFSNLISKPFKKWLINCYNLGDVILTPTPYSKKILENYNLSSEIIPVSNGVDLEIFAKDRKKAQKFREYFDLSKDDKVIISVGHYFERKGLPDFIQVARSFPQYKFIWFGHTASALITKDIKQAINNKPDNVILPGYIKGEIIQGAYSAADIFFFPSHEETEGIVILEALASKCQVLVRDIGVYEDWLTDGVNCYKANSNSQFEIKIKELIEGQLPSTISAGYEVAKNRSLINIGKELRNIYESLLQE